ncbi:MAG: hypothetical protein A3K19_16945 [Lentisphaerae bacterium RIFOXYB12_FULL_65_16]|nr:MAG: hypothetical protein A3K18_17905 [Lentisphaerae bacterium RIFOXYA12_64_32]OGV88935.1 MAG: hypothetical protein A3K19_16945 [Lentisphaerae bacterium RIFOXYB12_FULL_65_16]
MKAADIKIVTVVGAGTMGAGIAGEFARAGCNVRLVDTTDAFLERGMSLIAGAQTALVGAKCLTAKDARAAQKRIRPTTDLKAACAGTQLLIEAVSENMTVKRQMFRQFDAFCPKKTALASNTSGLSITAMGRLTKRPNLVAGLHFWNPPHLIPLVEVTQGKRTAPATTKLLLDVCRRLGKRPVLVKHDVPGFIGNRLQFAVVREALHILSEGIASAEDIDTAMTAGPGLRYGLLGPLRTADLGGLDIFLAISQYLFPELSAETTAPVALRRLVEKGRLGAKSGRGFYGYSKADLPRILAQRDRVLLGFLKVLRDEQDR